MSRNTKIILAVISGLIVVGGCICLVGLLFFQNAARTLSNAVMSNPTDVAAVSANLAIYELPTDYEESALNMLGLYRGVVLTERGPEENRHLITLFSVPNLSDQEQAQFVKLLEQRMGQGSSDIQWDAPSSRPVQIRSQQVDLLTRKGTNKNGRAFQIDSAVFQGVNGSVILMIAGPQQGWDQETFDRFIQSIH